MIAPALIEFALLATYCLDVVLVDQQKVLSIEQTDNLGLFIMDEESSFINPSPAWRNR